MSLSRPAEDVHDLLEILQDELRCDICLKTISEPKTLACLHSFCRICVDRLMKVAANTHDLSKLHRRHFFSCPVCRKRHAIPCNGVDGLQSHFKLANLCSILQKKQASVPDPGHKCSVHPNQIVDAFCSNCLCCICSSCKESHENHEIKDIENASKFYRTEISNAITQCSSMVRKVDNHVNEIDGFLNKEADLIAAVKTTKNKLVTSVENQEREQLQQIRTLFTNR